MAVRLVTRPEDAVGEGEDVVELLHNYDKKWLDCRDLRHTWKLLGYYRANNQDVFRTLRCERCECEATDHWTASGYRWPRRYEYPDGYQLKGSRVAAVEVRVEVLSRATIFESQDQMIQSVMKRRGRANGAAKK